MLITYANSREITPMYNENNSSSYTSETDSSGGTRTIEEEESSKEIVYTEEDGKNIPATQTIINPRVEGVIVTAKGADDINVRSNIIAAVVAVTGAEMHKVQVFGQMK